MISTQISLASFAQAQIAPAPITSQAELDMAKPFGGPLDVRRSMQPRECAGGWNGHFFIDWQANGMLDAPDWLPIGSHHVGDGYKEVIAIAHSPRD